MKGRKWIPARIKKLGENYTLQKKSTLLFGPGFSAVA
jgi:hypothetical protein